MTVPGAALSLSPSMRGRRRSIASVLAESLSRRPAGRLVAIRAAFAEACGQPLARQVGARGFTPDGRLLVVARTAAWARELERLAGPICARMAQRLGTPLPGLEVRLGPPSDRE